MAPAFTVYPDYNYKYIWNTNYFYPKPNDNTYIISNNYRRFQLGNYSG